MDQTQQNRIKQNIAQTRKGTQASRYGQQGLTQKAAKMNSANFQKLMTGRNLSKGQTNQVWNSFSHSPKSPVMARHASKGENFKMTSGNSQASGIYVSKKSFGKTPTQRINRGALPPSNTATKQQNVKLAKNQNVVYGKVAPQPSFQKADPKGLARQGGGMQTVTNGGFSSGALKSAKQVKGPSYAQKSVAFKKAASAPKTQSASKGLSKGVSKGPSKGTSQSRSR